MSILDSFNLPLTVVDLAPRTNDLSDHVSAFTGRSLLTKHAKRALLDAFKATDAVPQNLRSVDSIVGDEDFHVLSQALSGFNDALIQTRQAFQLPVADPLAFEDYRPFSEDRVRRAVGRHGLTSPQPQLGFHPLRAGVADILRLRLIDTFGRVVEIDPSNISRSSGLHRPGHESAITLRPRITQPARLDFRWLSGESGREEASEVASDNPICGWITPDYLDHALHVHDRDGTAVGRLTQDPDAPWREPVGQSVTGSIENIENAHLRRVVNWLNRRDSGFRAAFVDVLHQGLANIHPDTFANHPALAFLMGRPLAVVRARLSLSLKGLPATHQGWVVFRQDLHRAVRDSWGFEDVRFPARLGEHHQVNDGLLGFWLETDEHTLGSTFIAPNADAVGAHQAHVDGLAHPGERDRQITLSVSDQPLTVTMLVDPRAKVHATTGILPVKSIGIPTGHFDAALRRLEFSFPVAPILTPRASLTVPLPRVPGFDVSWITRDGDGFRHSGAHEIEPHEPHKTDTGAQRLIEGWMRLKPNNDPSRP